MRFNINILSVSITALIFSTGCSNWLSISRFTAAGDSGPPTNLSYESPSITAYQNFDAINSPVVSVTGKVNSYEISPALPAGLALNSVSGAITGTPVEFSSARPYIVTASNSAGQAQVTVTIAVLPTYTVNSLADAADADPNDQRCDSGGGSCSLRAAIQQANALNLPTKVLLPAGTVSLNLGAISFSAPISIRGASSATTIIDAAGSSGIFNATSSSLTLEKLTLQNGLAASSSGGAINFAGSGAGSLSINDVSILNNAAGGSAGGGGGVYFDGSSLTIQNSSFNGNTQSATTGTELGGGALYIKSGAAKVTQTLFKQNHGWSGGAVYVAGGMSHSFSGCTFQSNDSNSGGGGALRDHTFSDMKISKSSFISNAANGHGAAIFVDQGFMQVVENVTFYGNAVAGGGQNGGAIYFKSSFSGPFPVIRNSTFKNNSAAAGGAIFSAFVPGSKIEVASSIFSANSGANCAATWSIANFESLGGNIEDSSSCGFSAIGDLASTDPLLVSGSPLDNGGPTQTIALQAGSPARSASGAAVCATTDQRGNARPIAAACDSGAYQY